MLAVSNLSASAKVDRVLRDVIFDVQPGRPTAIVGLSRAGRDAVARLLTGMDRPQAGSIKLSGVDVARARRNKGRILRVGPAIPAPSSHYVSKFISADAAARAGLSASLNAKVKELAPDKRMRLAIAQAVAARPALLILDAPASVLPASLHDDFAEHLGEIVAGSSAVVLLLASGAHEALGLRGDIVVLDGGAVLQTGAASDVSAHPVNLVSAIATSWPALNTLPMTAAEGRCMLSDGSRLQLPDGVSTPQDGDCTLAFHPEDATLERASPGCVRFVVRAGAEEVRGEYRFLNVTFANREWMCPLEKGAPHAGALLNAFVDRSHLLVFDADGRAIG
jgi:ABC-type sugar transport system ATPase subunit